MAIQVTVYPKGLLFAAVFLIVFGVALSMAVDAQRGVVGAGIVAAVAYVVIDVFIAINPGAWKFWGRQDRE